MEALSMLDEIVQELERQENSTRIKKLVFYACKNYWENDLNTVNSFKLQDLLQELRYTNPTIEQLRSTLENLVETINHKAEYSLVANTILSRISKLYLDEEPSTQVIFVRTPNLYDLDDQAAIVNEIAKDLEQNQNSVRIKKLILYISKNLWENNLNILNSFKFQDLIQELRSSYSTLEQLSSNIYAAVVTLNRPTEYALIAYTIVNKLEKLYKDDEEPTAAHSAKTAQSSPTLQKVAKLSSAHSAKTAQSSPTLQKAAEPLFNRQPKFQQPQSQPSYDPFELRLAIMRYTNPLRAKILLFSALYKQFNPREQDWSALRNKELDELLFALFSQCSTIKEVELQLNETAKCLEEPDESTQAAAAIIKSMRPLYSNSL